MNRLQRTLLVILLLAALSGTIAIVTGAFLGAHPFQIGETILQEASERGSFDLYVGIRNFISSSGAFVG